MVYKTHELARLASEYLAFRDSQESLLGQPATASSLSIAMVGKGNNRLIERLLNGSSINLTSAERASEWFINNWPDTLAWPEDILRPDDIKNGRPRTETSNMVGTKVHKATV